MPDPIVRLRDVVDSDLGVFFEQQLDAEAKRMAAFVRKDPDDRGAFDAHWRRNRGDSAIVIRTIVMGGGYSEQVAGHVLKYEQDGAAEISYWLGRAFWGRGIATTALRQFLERVVMARPLVARAAADNVASLRVLEKCGFVRVGADRGFSNARGEDVDEIIFRLRE